MNDNNTTKPSSSEHIRELKIDSSLWATPPKIINLLDFKHEKLSTNTKNHTAERIKIHQVRYEKGYFNFSDNIGTLDMIFFNDDQ